MALPDERFEICHLLDADARARILPALRLRLLPCPLGGPGGMQRVQSLYFGEPPAPGAEPRRRLRIRLHQAEGRPPRCVVEVKHRVGLRSVVHHAAVTLADARALVAAAPIPGPPAARAVLEEARALVATQALRPTCLVAHGRLAMIGGDDEPDLRVTFDTDLRWRITDLGALPDEREPEGDVLAPGRSLLVIKVARAVPSWLTLLLGRAGATSRSPGKHALAMQAAGTIDEARAGRLQV
jgi:hypothetical protein